MPRVHRRGKGRQTEIEWEQYLELEIGGPDDDDPRAFDPANPHHLTRSAFSSPFTRQAAWYQHKERLMENSPAGMRPWAFYKFELGVHPPGGNAEPAGESSYAAEARFLEEHGLLTAEEKAQLAAIASLKGAEWNAVHPTEE